MTKKKEKRTKHTHKTKDRVTRPPLKTGGELRYSGREVVSSPLVAPFIWNITLYIMMATPFVQHKEENNNLTSTVIYIDTRSLKINMNEVILIALISLV